MIWQDANSLLQLIWRCLTAQRSKDSWRVSIPLNWRSSVASITGSHDTARCLSSDSIRSKESWLPGISFWRGAQRTARCSRHWSGGFCVLEKVERPKTHYHLWFKNEELDAVELVALSCILWILWVCDVSMSINPLDNLARCLWTLQCHGGPGGTLIAFHTFSAKCLLVLVKIGATQLWMSGFTVLPFCYHLTKI